MRTSAKQMAPDKCVHLIESCKDIQGRYLSFKLDSVVYKVGDVCYISNPTGDHYLMLLLSIQKHPKSQAVTVSGCWMQNAKSHLVVNDKHTTLAKLHGIDANEILSTEQQDEIDIDLVCERCNVLTKDEFDTKFKSTPYKSSKCGFKSSNGSERLWYFTRGINLTTGRMKRVESWTSFVADMINTNRKKFKQSTKAFSLAAKSKKILVSSKKAGKCDNILNVSPSAKKLKPSVIINICEREDSIDENIGENEDSESEDDFGKDSDSEDEFGKDSESKVDSDSSSSGASICSVSDSEDNIPRRRKQRKIDHPGRTIKHQRAKYFSI